MLIKFNFRECKALLIMSHMCATRVPVDGVIASEIIREWQIRIRCELHYGAPMP